MPNNPSNDFERPADRAITDRPIRQTGGWAGLIEPMILTWRLFWDGRVAILPKIIPVAAAVYVISPIDFIPELAFGPLGLIDDAGVIILALNLFIYVCPPDIVNEHRRQLGFSVSAIPGPDKDVIDGSAEANED